MSVPWGPRDAETLNTLAGRRGAKDLHAVRRAELDDILKRYRSTLSGLYLPQKRIPGQPAGTVTAEDLAAAVRESQELVAQAQEAVATIDRTLADVYGVKAQDGGAVSLLELIALDGTNRPPTSILKASADSILLDGTVGTEKLIVGTGSNLLSNADFLHARQDGTAADWKTGTSGPVGARSRSRIRGPGGSFAFATKGVLEIFTDDDSESGYFSVESAADITTTRLGTAVEPGRVYEGQVRVSGLRCAGCRVALKFYDADGNYIAQTNEYIDNPPSGSSTLPMLWPRVWVKREAPPNAATASLEVRKYGTKPGEPNSYLFLAEPQIALTHAAAERPNAYSPGSTATFDGGRLTLESILTKHIATDAILARHIKAGEIIAEHIRTRIIDTDKIRIGGVETDNIAQNNVSGIYTAYGDGGVTINIRAGYMAVVFITAYDRGRGTHDTVRERYIPAYARASVVGKLDGDQIVSAQGESSGPTDGYATVQACNFTVINPPNRNCRFEIETLRGGSAKLVVMVFKR